VDHRDPELVEHELEQLLRQRGFGICCGYEDLNDHAALRDDPLMAAVVEKADPLGRDRRERKDNGHPLASPSTLNRLELTPADDLIHGTQEGRFFHGYYGNYCYLPLYIFVGDFLLCAKLRTSDIDGSAGSLDEVKRIVARIKKRWPKTKFVLRADSGFARDE